MVRFNATFDIRRGVALTPVSEIELFRPARQKRMSREQRLDQTPGIFPVTQKQDGDKGKSAPQTGAQGLAGAAAGGAEDDQKRSPDFCEARGGGSFAC